MDQITVTPRQAIRILKDAVENNEPVLVEGLGGIGKSDIAFQVARELFGPGSPYDQPDGKDSYFIAYFGSTADPVDIAGDPYIGIDGMPHRARPRICPQDGFGLVCADEINRNTPMVMNALMAYIRDGFAGDHVLGPGWRRVACCNPDHSKGVTRMSDELLSRFFHLTLVADVDDWCKWGQDEGGVSVNTIGYIRYQPQDLVQPRADGEKGAANPRTWTALDKMMQRDHDHADDLIIASGHVGQERAVKYVAFCNTIQKINLDAILLDPANASIPDEAQLLYAASAGLAARAKPDNFGRILTYLDRIPSEFQIFAVKGALKGDESLALTPEFTRWAIKHSHEF